MAACHATEIMRLALGNDRFGAMTGRCCGLSQLLLCAESGHSRRA
jgi:hypothetical protein